MRDAVLEALPRWRYNGNVIGVVNAPVGPCINLLRIIRIHNDRVDRDIRKIAGLICPCERAAIGSAGYLENVARRGRRISVESADCRVPHRQIRGRDSGIERNAQHRSQRNNGVISGNIYPVRLRLSAGAEIKPDPDVGVVCPKHRHAVILRRVLDLVDKRTVSQGLLGHVLRSRVVRYVPVSGTHGSVAAVNRLPHPRACCNEVTATAGNAGRGAIVTAWDAAVKKIVWHDERSRIAEPATSHAAPRGILIRAVTDATVKSAAIVTLEKAEARTCAYRIDA